MAGVVLCGGTSRRLGVDKSTLIVAGEPLYRRAARALAAIADPVVIASGGNRRLGATEWEEVDDGEHPGDGPVAGILAGLRASPHDLIAVVAVDLPFASVELLGALRARWQGEAALVPVDANGRPQPLHALYRRTAAPALSAYLGSGGRRVDGALEAIGAAFVDAADLVEPGRPWSFNLNAAGDITELRRFVRQLPVGD